MAVGARSAPLRFMGYFTHLECSVPCGAGPFDARARHFLCPGCGMPLLARYDLDAARAWPRDSCVGREPTMWRYRELMPLLRGERRSRSAKASRRCSTRSGWARRSASTRLFIKDESLNPTNSFKARGQSAAMTRARALGAQVLRAAHGRQRRQCDGRLRRGGRPRLPGVHAAGRQAAVHRECRLYGATITLVDGLITDAGRDRRRAAASPLGWYDVSTLKEPYRVEGKKTMGYELAEQMDWTLPDWIIYPTGGGTGLVGMWKAFDEMEALGWLAARAPPAHGVGAGRGLRADRAGVRAGHREGRALGGRPHRRRRPARAARDWRLPRPAAVRESGGTAVAVSDAQMVRRHAGDRQGEGVSAAPEGGAALPPSAAAAARGGEARTTGGALQHRRRAEVSRRARRNARLRASGPSYSPNEIPIARAVDAGRSPAARSSSSHHFGEWHGHDVGWMVRHHLAELPAHQQLHGAWRRSAWPARDRTRVGVPPRCRWPSTAMRASFPVISLQFEPPACGPRRPAAPDGAGAVRLGHHRPLAARRAWPPRPRRRW